MNKKEKRKLKKYVENLKYNELVKIYEDSSNEELKKQIYIKIIFLCKSYLFSDIYFKFEKNISIKDSYSIIMNNKDEKVIRHCLNKHCKNFSFEQLKMITKYCKIEDDKRSAVRVAKDLSQFLIKKKNLN